MLFRHDRGTIAPLRALAVRPAATAGHLSRRVTQQVPARVSEPISETDNYTPIPQAMTVIPDKQVVQPSISNGVGIAPDAEHAEFLAGVSHGGLRAVLAGVMERDAGQPEFLSAVKEVALSLQPVFDRRPDLLPSFAQMCEPERQIIFRVPWLDDSGQVRINRGFRVQFNSAIGPFKGGLRFRPGVNLSIIKFLGFEQTFKNSLTTLPMGGAKGGSDFDPKGRSQAEIQRFCQSFMTELFRHIGAETDVPAGDIGVGTLEIGYMYGQYKRIANVSTGVLTGKGLEWGGSRLRPEATGYGVVLFALELLADVGDSLRGKRCVVSGSGNVAQHCAKKLLDEGAVVLAMSDSRGYIYEPEGITQEQLQQIMCIKNSHNGRLQEYSSPTVRYVGEGRRLWEIDAAIDMAFPCATQHELDGEDARQLGTHGCQYVFEGANMPCTPEAVRYFHEQGVVYAPGKAANAGGVAVSGLEMQQNRQGMQWTEEEVDDKLRRIMAHIYQAAKAAAKEYGTTLAAGANIAGFIKVAEAVKAQGAV